MIIMTQSRRKLEEPEMIWLSSPATAGWTHRWRWCRQAKGEGSTVTAPLACRAAWSMSWTIMGFRYFPFFIALVDSWPTMGWTWTLPPHYGLSCQIDHMSLEVYPTAHLILHLYTRHRQNSIFTGADQEDKFPRATSKWQGIKEIISSGFFLGHFLVVGTLDTSLWVFLPHIYYFDPLRYLEQLFLLFSPKPLGFEWLISYIFSPQP